MDSCAYLINLSFIIIFSKNYKFIAAKTCHLRFFL